mmetsp:Transcript_8299/g.14874  ORF Transcript_8299/g.14874 Transcript_8299/m.14874 type:complete len:81 (+) Transcript_8299:29-271(+)
MQWCSALLPAANLPRQKLPKTRAIHTRKEGNCSLLQAAMFPLAFPGAIEAKLAIVRRILAARSLANGWCQRLLFLGRQRC